MRLKFNVYSYREAFNRLEEGINQQDNPEIYASIGELLLCVVTTEQWHHEHNISYRDQKIQSEDGLVVFGLRHAHNMIKHNMDFFQSYQTDKGGTFPVSFNTLYNKLTEYRWINSINV